MWVGTKGAEAVVEFRCMNFSLAWMFLFVLSQIMKGQESLLILSTCVDDLEKASVKFYKVSCMMPGSMRRQGCYSEPSCPHIPPARAVFTLLALC